MTKIINQIRNKPWKYLFDSKVMSIFINNIFNIINIMKRNSFFYTKNNVTSLTKEYNKYQKSPNEKILLTSSMLNKKPLTQYKEIIYYNTVDDKLRRLIQEKRIDVIEEESKKEGKNIILEQLMNLLQNNYGNGKKQKKIMFAV